VRPKTPLPLDPLVQPSRSAPRRKGTRPSATGPWPSVEERKRRTQTPLVQREAAQGQAPHARSKMHSSDNSLRPITCPTEAHKNARGGAGSSSPSAPGTKSALANIQEYLTYKKSHPPKTLP
jgi:hypothetical protein